LDLVHLAWHQPFFQTSIARLQKIYLDGKIIPREGNSAAFEGGDAPAQDEGVNSVAAGITSDLPLPHSSVDKLW
jgi:hypothetical protein